MLVRVERFSAHGPLLARRKEEVAHSSDGGILLTRVEVREVDLDGGVLVGVGEPARGDECGIGVEEREDRLDLLQADDACSVGVAQSLLETRLSGIEGALGAFCKLRGGALRSREVPARRIDVEPKVLESQVLAPVDRCAVEHDEEVKERVEVPEGIEVAGWDLQARDSRSVGGPENGRSRQGNWAHPSLLSLRFRVADVDAHLRERELFRADVSRCRDSGCKSARSERRTGRVLFSGSALESQYCLSRSSRRSSRCGCDRSSHTCTTSAGPRSALKMAAYASLYAASSSGVMFLPLVPVGCLKKLYASLICRKSGSLSAAR